MGPGLVDVLKREFSGHAAGAIEFLTDFQLQIEHALDLQDRQLVLFADAHIACDPPFGFELLQEARDDSYTSHAMSPAAVLHVYRRVCGGEPPPTFLLSMRGQRFGLGEDLGAEAQAHLAASLRFCRELLVRPELSYWRRCCTLQRDGGVTTAAY